MIILGGVALLLHKRHTQELPALKGKSPMLRKMTPLCFCLLFLAPSVSTAVDVGDTVLAYWKPAEVYFVGTVVEEKEGGFLIVFEDGDAGVVEKAKVRAYDIEVGTVVYVRWEDGKFYPGKVAKTVGRALYVNYDDGDKGWAPLSAIAVE